MSPMSCGGALNGLPLARAHVFLRSCRAPRNAVLTAINSGQLRVTCASSSVLRRPLARSGSKNIYKPKMAHDARKRMNTRTHTQVSTEHSTLARHSAERYWRSLRSRWSPGCCIAACGVPRSAGAPLSDQLYASSAWRILFMVYIITILVCTSTRTL